MRPLNDTSLSLRSPGEILNASAYMLYIILKDFSFSKDSLAFMSLSAAMQVYDGFVHVYFAFVYRPVLLLCVCFLAIRS